MTSVSRQRLNSIGASKPPWRKPVSTSEQSEFPPLRALCADVQAPKHGNQISRHFPPVKDLPEQAPINIVVCLAEIHKGNVKGNLPLCCISSRLRKQNLHHGIPVLVGSPTAAQGVDR